jgi:hypothetical protein
MKTVFKQIAWSLVFISMIISPTLAFDMQLPEDALSYVRVKQISPSPVATGELRALAASLASMPDSEAGDLGSDDESVDREAEIDDEISESEPKEIRRLDKVFSDYVMRKFVRRG